ncbi:hypothetical protein I4U23_021729 [Adineta vaga]|nr:hypothetical protein I4U23_021729 [Adineta vaga]
MNDITNTKLFEVILDVFRKNGLLREDMNTDEQKKKEEKAYEDCLPFIKQIQENNSNLNEQLLQLMNILSIDNDSKISLDNIFKQIIAEINILKNDNLCLKSRICALEDKIKLKEANCISYDMFRLFLFYFVEPAIRCLHPTWDWNNLTNQWTNQEEIIIKSENMDDENIDDPLDNEYIQNHQLIRTILGPIEVQLKLMLGREVNLCVLRKISKTRHTLVHDDVKSVPNQRVFLLKCKNFEFPDQYEYTDHVKDFTNMILALDQHPRMAPGGEFRTAFREAQKVPGCQIVLGDRPVGITLKRAINSLSTWKRIRLAWSLLTSKDKITNEDVEKCMEHDMLEKLLLEMSGEYPELSRVFINERDQFLSYSLRKCTQRIPIETNESGFVPSTVVGVVGIGHVQGIVKQWNLPPLNDVQHLMKLTLDDKPIRHSSFGNYASLSLKLVCLGAIIAGVVQYTRYRLR